jgi:2-oxoglutarate ferredoxin oxidoreductase subunit alpha
MIKDVFTFLVGGKAGEGVKKAGSVVAQIFISQGLQIFQMDDYMSLIRGGHNFSVVSTSDRWISSQYLKADVIVNFDQRSYETHKNHLAEEGLMVYNSDKINSSEGLGIPMTSEAKNYPNPDLMLGVGAVAVLAALISFPKNNLEEIIKREYPYGIDNNISYGNRIYDLTYSEIGKKFHLPKGDKKRISIYGNYAITLGAIAGGLDIYYAYPMTPASSILHYFATLAKDLKLAVVQPENEIAVINMAIGSAFAGAKTMVGTSGGGFALMNEGISLAGMVEAPVLCVLSMRPGPATGVPTYSGQGDLHFALNAGHGEFLRIVASPGTIEEAYYLTAQMLDLVWKFQTPGILLTELHLSESSMTVDLDIKQVKWAEGILHAKGPYKRYIDTESGVSPLLFPPSKELIKWNSHEHDENGITTENPELVTKMHEKRYKKFKAIENYLKKEKTVNIFGNNGLHIFTYGSTTMSVLEAIRYGDIEAKLIQPIFLSPYPKWELDKYKDKEVIVVENSIIGQFSNLLREKGGLNIKTVIKQYDGRPFDPIELSKKIKEVI